MRRLSLGFLVAVTSTVCAMGASASCASFRTTSTGATDGGATNDDDAHVINADGAHGDDDGAVASDGSQPNANDTGVGDDSGSLEASTGAVCTQSTCTVTPLISHLYGPAALATDVTYVYWLEVGTGIPQADGEGQFVRLKKTTTCTDRSCVEVIDPFALSGTFEDQLIYGNLIAVGPDDACYAQSYNATSEHSIDCFPLSSLDKTSIDQDFGECDDLTIAGGSILWSIASTTDSSSDGSIRIHPLVAGDGGAAPAVVSDRPDPTAVIADGTGVVWTEDGPGDAGGGVHAIASDGGITSFASGGGPVAVAEYAGYVYWLDAVARTISRAARSGGAVEQIANTDANPFALVVDPSGVYWASAGLTNPDGSVGHAPLVPGGPTTVMMSDVIGIQALAVDATTIYVAAIGNTVNGGGSIQTMPKTRASGGD